MYKIDSTDMLHDFEKTNIVTQKNGYDEVKCRKCGLVGKRFLDIIFVRETKKNKQLVINCNGIKVATPNTIEIILQPTGNPAFANLIVGSVHKVVESPEKMAKIENSVWVQGVGDKVRLLQHEYKKIN